MKASSESGECASLIWTGSFSVLGAVCGPGMGASVSFSGATAKWLPRPGLGPSQRDFPAEERVYRRRTEESLRVARACVALGRTISCKTEPSILMSGEQLEGAKKENRGSQRLKRRDHSGNGVVEGGAAVKVGLPEFLQQLEVLVPATLIEAFAQGVGSVAPEDAAVLVTGSRARRAKHRADDFTGGVENQSMPEVAWDGFIALPALADDGGLHRLGDTVRTLVEEHLKGFCALIACVQAGDRDPQGIG